MIRRIRKEDSKQEFRTGKASFDRDPNGKDLGLGFYVRRDRTAYESYVLVDCEIVVGILCMKKRQDSLYLSRIGVRENHQFRGNGAQLLKFAIEKAIEYGFRRIELEAQGEVISFFKEVGFVVTKTYADTYWGNSATMELSLQV